MENMEANVVKTFGLRKVGGGKGSIGGSFARKHKRGVSFSIDPDCSIKQGDKVVLYEMANGNFVLAKHRLGRSCLGFARTPRPYIVLPGITCDDLVVGETDGDTIVFPPKSFWEPSDATV